MGKHGREEALRSGVTRRGWLTSAAVGGTVLATSTANHGQSPSRPRSLAGMNVVLFVTDQQRLTMQFPPGWEQRNLPGMTRLKRYGLSFENACTNTCMCSPARATLMTGFFPAQHGVKYTLEENMSPPENPQVQLPLPNQFKNLATVLAAAGYQVVYKGKWHLSKPAPGAEWTPSDVGKYGFNRWDPPDAGANQDLDQGGGGDADNDGRYMDDDGPWPAGQEGALAYINNVASAQQPFFLIVSLVNPHDVLMYPNTYQMAGYTDEWLRGDIHLPLTINESLSSKPTVQRQFLEIANIGLGELPTRQLKRNYLNFYGNLMKSSDNYLEEILNALQAKGLFENTLMIQTSDHGEMGLSHGGLRQKMFNFYEETLRVPMVYSNPRLFPHPIKSQAMVSHVDLLPTLANLFNVPASARSNWQGVDYSRLVLNPSPSGSVQDYLAFTFDDYQTGEPMGPYPTPPNHIVSIREARYKLAEYYDVEGNISSQYEMYDRLHDPLEVRNLAAPGVRRSPAQQRQYERLLARLQVVKQTRLRPPS